MYAARPPHGPPPPAPRTGAHARSAHVCYEYMYTLKTNNIGISGMAHGGRRTQETSHVVLLVMQHIKLSTKI